MTARRLDPQSAPRLFVIADVHGDFDALSEALERAPSDAHVVFLGDLVDRGPYAPLCAATMLELVATGRADFLPGNHDVALVDVVRGDRAATPHRIETLAQFEALSGDTLDRFCALVETAPLALRWGDYAFVHAAWRAEMDAGLGGSSDIGGPWSEDTRRVALLGETIKRPGKRRRETVYRWVDRLPKGLTAVVGHDVRSVSAPPVVAGARGGRAVFLDLGCGKGGALGCAEVTAESLTFVVVPSAIGAGAEEDGDET